MPKFIHRHRSAPPAPPAPKTYSQPATTVHEGAEISLTMENLNAGLYAYAQLHTNNFPGVTFDKATLALFQQCPSLAQAYANKKIEPEDEFAIAEEALTALAKQYQLRFQKDFRESFQAVCEQNPTLKKIYAAPMGGVHSRSGGMSASEAGDQLSAIADAIVRETQSLSWKEAFMKARKQRPDLATAYDRIQLPQPA